jgi:hypothetical protein
MLLPVASINRVLACFCGWLPRCLPSRTLHFPLDALVPKPLPRVSLTSLVIGLRARPCLVGECDFQQLISLPNELQTALLTALLVSL